VPLLVFYSDKDTPKEEMRDWGRCTSAEVSFYKMDGMHFFLHAHEKEIAQIIYDMMRRWSNNPYNCKISPCSL
jgi:surfactin synthase thioesterase subunit